MALSDLLAWFVRVNRRASMSVERQLACARPNPSQVYAQVAGEILRGMPPGAFVVDVGGGRRCAVSGRRAPGVRIVAVDVSAPDLAVNRDVDETRVADVTQALPFGDAECDMLMSKHVLEHLRDVGSFIRESGRVLKPGGWWVHLMPARFAAYAVIRRTLPAGIAGRLLKITNPETAGTGRFAAYYDRCYASCLSASLLAAGFDVWAMWPSYYQSHYFAFLVPLYLVTVLWDTFCWVFDLRDLAGYLVVVARRRA